MHVPQSPSASRSQSPRRDPLSQLLDPLGLVVITRERLQEAFDDAVQRGRMTRDDAQELVAALVSRGRASTEGVLGDLERLLGSQRQADASQAEGEPGRAAGDGTLPFEGYDELTAVQITARLTTMSAAELRRVRDHEQRHANRKSVLQAVERKLA